MLQRPASVLVVDDQALAVEAVRRLLESKGFTVTAAEDGERALGLLSGQRFDLVLLDIMMPGMDGLAVLRRIPPAGERRSRPKIIMLSAITESDRIIEALRLGASDYVTKPIDYPVLLARMQTLLKQEETEGLLRATQEKLEQGVAVLRERIDEQETVEKSLREREQRLDAILSNIVEGIVTIDEQGVIQSFNPAAEKMFGYGEAEVLGKNVSVLVPDTDRRLFDRYIRHHLKAGKVKTSDLGFREIQARRKDGSEFPGELAVSEITIDGKRCFIGTIRDITQRKEAEKALRRSDDRLRGAIESMPEGFALFDADDRLAMINDVYRRINPMADEFLARGMTFEEAIRANVESGRIIEAIGREEEFLRERLARHRNFRHPIVRRHSDGTWYMVNETPTPEGGTAITFSDITELIQLQEGLRESEQWFRTIYHETPVMLHSIDATGRLGSVSDFWLKSLGYERNEVIGKKVTDFMIDDSARRAREQSIPAMVGTGRVTDFPVQFVKKDGSVIDTQVSAIGFNDENGEFLHTFTVVVDVTERNRAEKALKESEARFRAVIESSTSAITLKDRDGRYLLVNPTFASWMNAEPEALIGKNAAELFTDESEEIARLDHAVLETGDTITAEITLKFRDGISRDILTHKCPIIDETGEITAISTIVTDISERKRWEQELQVSKGRLRTVVDHMPNAVYLKDLEGRYLMVNKVYEQWYGLPVDAAVGRSTGDVFPDKVVEVFEAQDREVVETRQVVSVDMDIPTVGGEVRRTSAIKFPIFDADGDVVGLGGVNTDITEHERSQAQLVQADKLATLGRMASNIAHEMNQPLNVIRMAAESSLMRLDDDSLSDDALRKKLAQIEGQAVRMAEIIDHMRVLAREDKSRVEVFSPVKHIRAACDFLDEQLAAVGIRLEKRVPATCRPVSGRPVQFEQVILNLMANARDAVEVKMRTESEERPDWQGKVTVRLTDNKKNDMLTISVTDNGGGIPGETLTHVFDPFFTTKDAGMGMGLGLSISHGIVRAMGGDLAVANTRDGTRFTLTVPVSKDATVKRKPKKRKPHRKEKPKSDPKPTPPCGEMSTVLVVDDEELAVQCLAEHLERKGYRVATACNGVEALERYQAAPTDAVITDLRMPKMDGNELIRRLRAVSPDLPIFVTTGHTNIGEDKQTVNQGATAVLKKPVSLREITKRLEAATKAAGGNAS